MEAAHSSVAKSREIVVLSYEPSSELIVGDIDPGLESEHRTRNNENEEEEKPELCVNFEFDEKPIVPFEMEEMKPIVPFDPDEKLKVKVEEMTPDGESIMWNFVKDADIVKKEEPYDEDIDPGGDSVDPEEENDEERPLIDLTLEGKSTEPAGQVKIRIKLENETNDVVISKSTLQLPIIEKDPKLLSNLDMFEEDDLSISVGSDVRSTFNSDIKYTNKIKYPSMPSTCDNSGLWGNTDDQLHQRNVNETADICASGQYEPCEDTEIHDSGQTKTSNNSDRQPSKENKSFCEIEKSAISHENKERIEGTQNSKATGNNDSLKEIVQSSVGEERHKGIDKQSSENSTELSKKETAKAHDKESEQLSTAKTPQTAPSSRNVPMTADSPFKCTRAHVLKLECYYCGKIYAHRAVILKHIALHHGELSKQTVCDVCGKKMNSRESLIQHRKRNHSGKEFTCVTCSSKYKSKELLRIHITSKHLPPAPKKCRHCAKTFSESKSLKIHLNSVHKGGEKKSLCSVCGKSFPNEERLNVHILIHSGEKPHSCKECGKRFRTESNLSQHAITHSDARPFKCEICEKTFRIKHHLKQHMSTHGMASVPKYGRRGKKD